MPQHVGLTLAYCQLVIWPLPNCLLKLSDYECNSQIIQLSLLDLIMLMSLYSTFNDYCLEIGIDVEQLIAPTHAQNGLAESFIKCLKFVSRPLILNLDFPFTI